MITWLKVHDKLWLANNAPNYDRQISLMDTKKFRAFRHAPFKTGKFSDSVIGDFETLNDAIEAHEKDTSKHSVKWRGDRESRGVEGEEGKK